MTEILKTTMYFDHLGDTTTESWAGLDTAGWPKCARHQLNATYMCTTYKNHKGTTVRRVKWLQGYLYSRAYGFFHGKWQGINAKEPKFFHGEALKRLLSSGRVYRYEVLSTIEDSIPTDRMPVSTSSL